MATIKDFKELEIWQLANALTVDVFDIIKNTNLNKDFELRNQIDRSSGSIPDNIAEGFERDGNREFIQFLAIAKGSCGEVRSQLNRLKNRGYVSLEKFTRLDEECISISKKINSFIKYLNNSEYKGNKFKEPEAEYTPNQKPETRNHYAHETAVIDEGCQIGRGTKIWHFSHIMPDCVLGENCNIGQNVVVSPKVVLGNNVKVQNNVSIYTGVTCDDDVFLGPSCVFTNVTNPRSGVNRRGEYAKTHVGKGASIGANATIVCGHDIGEYAFIGAGAVVTKDVPAYALLVGNPAKQLGWMSEYGHRLNFNDDGNAVCEESGEKYCLEKNTVKKIG